MKVSVLVLVLFVFTLFAADRVVLFGDFSTISCPSCAGSIDAVNVFVDGYLANDQIAPYLWFLSGPASNSFNLYLWNAYWSTGYVPTFVADGVFVSAGWSQSVWTAHVNDRLAVPSYLTIETEMVGDASGGTVTYTLTAEQDLQASSLKLFSAIVESEVTASSAYGLFAGKTLNHVPQVMPCGNTGTVIEFTGPYPQTIMVVKPYTLDPTVQVFDNLDIVSFVLDTSTKESMNAAFMDVPDTNTGIYSEGGTTVVSSATLAVWPNPSNSNFNISSLVPQGAAGTVEIFDIAGRSICQFTAGSIHNLTIEESGIYFVQLKTSSGEIVTEQMTMIR